MNLCELALKYDTDKGPHGHCYTAVYDVLFRDKNFQKILEIGIGPEAPSLKMWSEYFPEAEVWGADEDRTRFFNGTKIRSVFCNQDKSECFSEILSIDGPFDLIVDDGSHQKEHQLKSIKILLHRLNSGGFYIIEDVSEGHSQELFKEIKRFLPCNCFIFLVETKDDNSDSRLLIIKKE